ncbi:MAG: hypothetical protein NWQ74_07165 [Opitutales bacterium]|jgi:hypothetical protein|nr:hypothetical protein [Opitutales bacterium]MDP4658311.1 hypothetical protein [Opitutales bacterium]MDP4775990.1 hypothetical protein [Opitutales bacterium]MDP4786831.1 hypothetical protein [Opitutales bacterium]MDP4860571.1 hypothetical protein [Opitutales bacterium]
MGLREEFLAKFARLKAEAEARQASMAAGREAKVLTDDEVARGHPKVKVESGFQGVSYGVRLGTAFGWLWLIFTCVHCVALFYGMSQGSVKVNGRMVTQPDWWHFALLALFYVPFFLVGFAFTIARYRLTLTDELVTLRWRILPYLGWTSTLPAGDAVKVTLAFRGSKQNKQPVDAVVVASQGKEIHFGAFLPEDVKEHLAGLIRHYYGDAPSADVGSAAPFIANP